MHVERGACDADLWGPGTAAPSRVREVSNQLLHPHGSPLCVTFVLSHERAVPRSKLVCARPPDEYAYVHVSPPPALCVPPSMHCRAGPPALIVSSSF
jgi:hypothetical protein